MNQKNSEKKDVENLMCSLQREKQPRLSDNLNTIQI